jgi:hypothetical protein
MLLDQRASIKTITDSKSFEEILEDKGWSFEGPMYQRTDLPQAAERYNTKFGPIVGGIERFLTEGYIMINEFESYQSREAFVRDLNREHPGIEGWIRDHNNMRTSKVASVYMAMQAITHGIEKSEPRQGRNLRRLYESVQLDRRFNDFNNDEKKEYVLRLNTVVYQFLTELVEVH